jgi:protein-tyrosine-phosphatase
MENKLNRAKRYRVLFVCLGNSCRSPMAEAIARQTAADVMVAASAGTMALGFVAPPTLKVLEERGIKVEGLSSKPITRETRGNAEIIINMTGSPARRVLLGEESKTEDWLVTDPYGERVEAYRDTCDEIEARMTEFAARLRARRSMPAELAAK